MEMNTHVIVTKVVSRLVFALLAIFLAVVPAMRAEAVPPRAPTLQGVVVHDEELQVYGLVNLGTFVPFDQLTTWVSSYKIQWKSGDQEYDSSREASVTVTPLSGNGQTYFASINYRISGLSNSVEYTIRALAVNSDGPSPPSNEITGTPNPGVKTKVQQLREYIEKDIVETHETSFPWLRQTWTYMNNNNVRIRVSSSGSSRVELQCSSSFGSCRTSSMTIRADVLDGDVAAKKRTVLHELAHVYTLTNGISSTPAPLAAAFLYFQNLNLRGSRCTEHELFADVLTSRVLGGSTTGLSYWPACGGTSHTSTAQGVVRSAVGGTMPSWFATNYNNSDGNPNLRQVWADLLGLAGPRTRKSVAYGLRNSFGGYCSQNALSSGLTWGSLDETVVRSPWSDDGCLPSAPRSLTAVSGGDGTISVSWEPPESDGGRLQYYYNVQWKPRNAVGDRWQSDSVAVNWRTLAPTRVSHTITGVNAGAEYTVRVFAFGLSGTGPAAEATVTPAVADAVKPALLWARVVEDRWRSCFDFVEDEDTDDVRMVKAPCGRVVLAYSEALDETSVPGTDTFTVNAGSEELRIFSTVMVRGSKVWLSLASAVTSSDTFTIGYTLPADVNAPRIQDIAGNDAASITNQAATNLIAEVAAPVADESAPELSLGTVAGDRLVLTFNESLDETSEPAAGTFAVRVGSVARGIAQVAVEGRALGLTLASPVMSSDAVTVSYTAPTGANAGRIRDEAGNDAVAFSGKSITNLTPREPAATPGSDAVAPVLLLATVEAVESRFFTRAGVVLTYNEALADYWLPNQILNRGSIVRWSASLADAFSVSVRNVARSVTHVSVSGSKVELTVEAFVTASDEVTVSYTVPTDANAARIQDEAGKEAAALSGRIVTNVTPQGPPPPDSDGVAPELLDATVEGDRLSLFYDQALDRTAEPAASSFAVSVGGDSRGVEAVWVGPDLVVLTLASPVTSSDTVTLSYTVPTDANEPRIRDAAGDAAGAITGEAVINITPQKPTETPVSDAVSPELQSAAVERTRLVLTYNEVLDDRSAPAVGAFAVRVASVARSVEDVSVEGHAVVLTLASAVTSSDAVTLSYTVPTDADAPRIQDAAGNDAGATSGWSVTNSTPAVSSDATLRSVDYAHRIVSLGDYNCAKQSPGGLFPPDSGAMTLKVDSSVESLSLFARTSNAYATVVYGPAADADGTTCGHQVTLAEGATVVNITVTAEDGDTTKPYSVTITRSDNIHNNPAAGVVAISGMVRVGETLTAMPFGIVDADGLSNAKFSYQWISNDGNSDAEIEGATAKTYTLVASDVEKTIRVRVSFTDDAGNAETLVSEATAEIPFVLSVADGNAHEGTDDSIDFEVSLNPAKADGTVTVAWETVDGTATNGEDYTAAGGTLTFSPGETAKTVSVVVLDDTVEDSGETFTLRLSNAVGATIADGEATGTIFNTESPFNSLPQVAGVAQVGNTLAVAFAEAPSGTVTYQWLRGSQAIAGARTSTYATTAADVGAGLSVQVESGGESLTGAATVPVWPAPVNPPLAAGEEELLSAVLTLGSYKSGVRLGGYGRMRGQSFGAMDNTAFEDGGTTYAIEQFFVRAEGSFTLATDSRLAGTAGLAAYWNGYRIAGLERTGPDGLLVGRTPQPESEYARYMDGASDGVRVAVSLRRMRGAAVRVTGASVASGPGDNGTWDEGERVEAEVRFSEAATVDGPDNAGPTLEITLDGATRTAAYAGGSGTETLTFGYTVTAGDEGARIARVVADGLAANGARILDPRGNDVELGFAAAPYVTGIAISPDQPGAREWVANETFELHVTFNEPVAVTLAGRLIPVMKLTVKGHRALVGYTSVSGSTLVFSWVALARTPNFTEVAVDANGLGSNGAAIVSRASGIAADLRHDATAPTPPPGETGGAAPLTAAFLDLPADGHGGNAFTVRLRFSEEFSLSYKTLQNHALGVTNGTLTGVSRVTQGEDRAWNVTVTPTGGGAVTVALPATTDCAAEGAICAGQRMLAAVSATVPETAQAPPPTPFKVSADLPAEHDGTSEIVFELSFNKRPQADYSYKTLRGKTLRIRQGGERLTPKVRRLNAPHNDRWEVTVTPGSKEDLTVLIGPFTSCSDEGAVCTAADEVLSNRIDRTIEGPPGLSVADARVHEGPGVTVDFAVTLARASAATVTVDYATSDGPSPNAATAGEDYESTSGTLEFAPGETGKTVSVPVLDDGHDEGEERFTLTLSNPRGGNAWLADATAVGTIENSDAMPKAWLARFGRTVAEQVLDAVEGRFSAQRSAGTEVSFAGVALGGASAEEREALEEREAEKRLAALSDWLKGETDADETGTAQERTLTGRDFLTGSSFALTGGTAQGGFASVWGRGAVSRFDGREGELTLSGEVASAMLGADFTRERDTVGVMVTHSRGEGSYRGEGEGEVESTLTGLYPYGRYEVNERVALWGVAGYGEGEFVLTPAGQGPLEAGMDLAMGAVGVRGVAVQAPAEGGLELSITSDAMAVRTSSEKVAGLVAATADVTRVRLGLEGTWRGLGTDGGATLVPTLEVGVRHDGGDAETGFGLDVGGGLAWSDPRSGLSVELRGRGLLTHEAGGFRDRGIAGSLGFDPRPDSERGFALTLSQTMGASASGGMDALLGRGTLEGLAANDDGSGLENRRLELKMGYGFGVFGDRFTATPEAGLGLSNGQREMSLGWRLGLEVSGPVSMELGLTGTRREAANDDGAEPVHALMLRGAVRW